MKAPWAPVVAAINAGGGWGGVREEKPAPDAVEKPEGQRPSNIKRAGKNLKRTMKKLARLKTRGARPRTLRRLASRAQRQLDDFKRRETAWQAKRDELAALGVEDLLNQEPA